MPKRFTDSAIWDKTWFRRLSPAEKCAFIYIKDKCDCVGVWDADFEVAEFQIGSQIDWQKLIEKVNGNIEILTSGKWWLCDFCRFQYGELKISCAPHKKYVEMLEKHRLLERVAKGYVKGSHTLQEEEEEEEEEKEKEKEKEKGVLGKRETGDIPYAEIIADLNLQAGMNYKSDGKVARQKIHARWQEGFRLDDFKIVHRKKVQDWKGGDMSKYLRPETLYGNKFEGYLNQLQRDTRISDVGRRNLKVAENWLKSQEEKRAQNE